MTKTSQAPLQPAPKAGEENAKALFPPPAQAAPRPAGSPVNPETLKRLITTLKTL